MEFLKEIGLIDSDIQEIKDSNYQHIIDNIELNQKNVQAIIDYLVGIGLDKSTIKEIFIYQIGLFFRTKEEIQASFDEYEIDSIIKSLSYDVNNIELIDFL